MASTTAESKATGSIPSVSNGVASGVETIPKILTSQSLVRRGSSSSASWLNWKRILEVVVLSCVIIATWGLFLGPTIVYALLPLQVSYYSYSYLSLACHSSWCLIGLIWLILRVLLVGLRTFLSIMFLQIQSNTIETSINISFLCAGMKSLVYQDTTLRYRLYALLTSR